MKKPLSIAIIGSGSAGPASAALLAQQGHRVSLFEKAPMNLPVGAGFMLQPSGMEVLRELNCLEKVLTYTDKIDSLFCKTTKGKVLLDLHYKEVASQLFGAGTQRSVFLDILLDKCSEDDVSTEWGTEVTSICLHKDKRIVQSHKKTLGVFDLVIISDGANSQLRNQLTIPQKVSVYPWGALWFIGKRTKEFEPNKLWQVVEGTSILNGFLPTGTKDNLLSFFYSLKLDQFTSFSETPLCQWRDEVIKTTPQAESFLEQINHHSQLKIARYHDVVMPYWHEDKVAILGDAAHALSPQLGQGVNLALQDAKSLADAIKNNETIDAALSSYSQERMKQVKFYQFATRLLTPWFQSDISALGKLRDIGFPLATKSKWVRNQMTMTMAGYKKGILASNKIKI